jgi:hypothetical protein
VDWAYHPFQAKREQFASRYFLRSNVEAVFSAIKRKLGEALLSKSPLARFNELLARLLAYNLESSSTSTGLNPPLRGFRVLQPQTPPCPRGQKRSSSAIL